MLTNRINPSRLGPFGRWTIHTLKYLPMPVAYDDWFDHRMAFPPSPMTPAAPAPNEPTQIAVRASLPASPPAEVPAPNEPTEPSRQHPTRLPSSPLAPRTSHLTPQLPNEPTETPVEPQAEGSAQHKAPAPNEPTEPPDESQTIDISSLTPENLAEIARAFPAGGGVYLLTDADDRLVQLASAGNLRRALRVRLLEPELADSEKGEDAGAGGKPDAAGKAESAGRTESDRKPEAIRKRARLAEIVRTIRWKPANSQFEITWRYYRIARALLPDDYREHIAFGPAWFVGVDLDAAFPRFDLRKIPRPGERHLGPFATRNDATRFIQILEDAFDLCRYYDILQQAPGGQACAYYEMGKCPAPCDGSISMDQYRRMMHNAWHFAAGDRRPHIDALEHDMKQAAAELAFERANAIKQKIERARAIEHPNYRHVQPLEDFNYLIVQRGSTRSRVKPFFVHQGCIEAGDEVALKKLEPALDDWVRRVHEPLGVTDTAEPRETSERLWLIAHFLYRKDPSGVYLHRNDLADARRCLAMIRETLAGSRKLEKESPAPRRDEFQSCDS